MFDIREVQVVAEGNDFVVCRDEQGLVYKVKSVLFPSFGFVFYRKPRSGDRGIVLLGLDSPIFIPMVLYDIADLPEEISLLADDKINASFQDVSMEAESVEESVSDFKLSSSSKVEIRSTLNRISGNTSVEGSLGISGAFGAAGGFSTVTGSLSQILDSNALAQSISNITSPITGSALATAIITALRSVRKPV